MVQGLALVRVQGRTAPAGAWGNAPAKRPPVENHPRSLGCFDPSGRHARGVDVHTSPAERADAHHEHGCCGGHRRDHRRGARGSGPVRSSLVGAILPVLACAVCPTCIGAWAQALSAVGVGFVMSETQHQILLVLAVGVTLFVSGRRYARSRRKGPLALALAGCVGLVASHLLGENQVLAWSSIVVLVAASIWQERARARKAETVPETRGALGVAEIPAGAE